MATSKQIRSRKTAKNGHQQPEDTLKARPFKRPLWELRLYVAGMTPTSIRAFENLKRLCEEHMHGAYKIQVVGSAGTSDVGAWRPDHCCSHSRPPPAHSGKENYWRPFKY